jgi:hypothetical protein
VVSKGENFPEKQAGQQEAGFTEERLDLSFCMPSNIRVDRTSPIFPSDWSAGPNLACKRAALVYHLIGVSYPHQIVQIKKKVMELTSAANLRSRSCNIYRNYKHRICRRGKRTNPTGDQSKIARCEEKIHTVWGNVSWLEREGKMAPPLSRRGGTDVRRLLPKPRISLSSLCMP